MSRTRSGRLVRGALAVAPLVALLVGGPTASAATADTPPPLPPLKRQASPDAVYREHFAAINACDWTRAMAQYDDNAEVHLSDGSVYVGRAAIGQLLWDFLKPRSEGGFCGTTFGEARPSRAIGNTVVVDYVATAAYFTAPYHGAESVVSDRGLIEATVSTTRAADFPLTP